MRDQRGRFIKGHKENKGIKKNGFTNSGTFKKGQIPWNKGLTRDDPRVAQYADKQKDRIDKICEFCGINYQVNRFRLKVNRFCSATCRARWVGMKYIKLDSFNRSEHNEYVYLHNWVYKAKGKAKQCEMCGSKNKRVYHWANKSGKYMKDVKDWISLCPKCHSKYDKERSN